MGSDITSPIIKAVYIITVVWPLLCLWRGHHTGKINIWDLINITAKDKTFVDPKKVAYIGTFYVMAATVALTSVLGNVLEWLCGLLVSAFVLGKWLGDREQRLARTEQPKQETKQ